MTGQEKEDLSLALNNFKTGSFARHPLFRGILDIEAHIQILEQGSPVFVLDLGVRSIITRLLPLINSFYKVPDLKLNILQRGNLSVYEYILNEDKGSSIFILFQKNLIFKIIEGSDDSNNNEKIFLLMKY